jgi:SAM-dependent methyltransferase
MHTLLYRQNEFPVFQNRMYAARADAVACPKGDIQLVEDLGTGLVYNAAFCPEKMVYDRWYQNEQAVSSFFQQHLNMVAKLIGRWMGTKPLVEVGCGKGFFLEMLVARGMDVFGFDPAYEGDNPRIRPERFGPGVMHGWAKGLILRHVLEHIQDPVTFLNHLKQANGGSGNIYIEVPCFDWICEHRAWFDIYYEHVNYFRMSDFHRLFSRIISSGHVFNNQYLYVIADLSSLRTPEMDRNDPVMFPEDFTCGITGIEMDRNGHAAIWGGASKGVIFALLRARAGCPVRMVIDINPAKQDRYLPGTGLKVLSPERAMAQLAPGSTIYVMNSNYLEEIRQLSENAYNYIGVDRE